MWSQEIQGILELSKVSISEFMNSQNRHLATILLEGEPGSGKTALAASMAMTSGVSFLEFITPESLGSNSEASIVAAIEKVGLLFSIQIFSFHFILDLPQNILLYIFSTFCD